MCGHGSILFLPGSRIGGRGYSSITSPCFSAENSSHHRDSLDPRRLFPCTWKLNPSVKKNPLSTNVSFELTFVTAPSGSLFISLLFYASIECQTGLGWKDGACLVPWAGTPSTRIFLFVAEGRLGMFVEEPWTWWGGAEAKAEGRGAVSVPEFLQPRGAGAGSAWEAIRGCGAACAQPQLITASPAPLLGEADGSQTEDGPLMESLPGPVPALGPESARGHIRSVPLMRRAGGAGRCADISPRSLSREACKREG